MSRLVRWLIDTVWFLRRYRSDERTITVTITADASAFEAAMRDAHRSFNRLTLGWHSPDNPYRHWPTCPGDAVGSSHEFWIPLGYACPGCKAAL